MKSPFLLLCLVVLFCATSFAQPSWSNYTNDRLISDVYVQGNNVWVGSQGGLTRTNLQTGEFQTYLPSNSPIVGGGIREIEKGPDGSMWFGSENAGVFHMKNGAWTHYYDGIVSDSHYVVRDLQVLPNGDAWFFMYSMGNQRDHELYRIRNGVVKEFKNLPARQAGFCAVDENTIFISYESEIYKYDVLTSQIVEIYNPGNSIISDEDEFGKILTDKNGALILSSPNRILKLQNGSMSVLSNIGMAPLRAFKDGVGNVYLSPYHHNPDGIRLIRYTGSDLKIYYDDDLMPYPASDQPTFCGGDHQGRVYASIFNVDSEYILYQFDGNDWSPVKSQIVPLLDNYQDNVRSDCDGNYWFRSRDGIDVRYADGSWENFTIGANYSESFSASKIVIDPATCDVWVSNNMNGEHPLLPGIVRISEGVVKEFLMGHGHISQLAATPSGKLYFYSHKSGFGYILNDAVHIIDHQGKFDNVTALESDSKGNIYIGDWDSHLYMYNGATFEEIDNDELGQYVFDLYIDKKDALWVMTSLGLMQYDGNQWNSFGTVWPSGTMSGMVEDRWGNYWVSTYRDGLFYWDKETKQQFTILNSALNSTVLYDVALDPRGNLIVTQLVGAAVLEIPNGQPYLKGLGSVFYDKNKNGLYEEPEDILVHGQKIKDTDRNLWSISNFAGHYRFYAEAADEYNFEHVLLPGAESTTNNPQSADIIDFQSVLPDFGFWKEEHADVLVTTYAGPIICDREFVIDIIMQNKSFLPAEGSLTVDFNEVFEFIKSSFPVGSVSTDQIVFDNVHIEPLNSFRIAMTFRSPGFFQQSMPNNFTGTFETSGMNFQGSTREFMLCSYDPNDKKVEPTGEYIEDFSLIQDALKYTIRFENEGTYKAFDIVIIDTLDSHLDPASFELIASSHEVEVTITESGIVTFVFPNIDLPARSDDSLGSQGYVIFSIKPDADLVTFERIFNKASIYFDFNQPIVTNNTIWNVVDDLSYVAAHDPDRIIAVYPNPSDGNIYLQVDLQSTYQVWSLTGKPMANGDLQAGQHAIQLNVRPGMYVLQVKDVTGNIRNAKLVIF